MKSFSDYLAQAGLEPIMPNPIIEWLAYKDGQCCVFDSQWAAKEFSKLVESRVSNKNEVDEARLRINQIRQDAYNFWFAALREDYYALSDSLFELCYNKALSLSDGGSFSLFIASRSISNCRILLFSSSRASGIELSSNFNFAALSSIKSMALSGKKRSVIYLCDNSTAAIIASSFIRT